MKATIADIIPGRVLYHVHFVPEHGNPSLDYKVIVTSKPREEPGIGLKFNSIDDYRPYGFNWNHVDSHHFLGDCGISKIHNMHRLFTSEESALSYVEECTKGVYSDPEDQKQFEVCTSPEHLLFKQNMIDLLDDMCDSMAGLD